MDTKIIANELKQLRKLKHFTQSQMAEMVGLHRLSYANVETGKTCLVNPRLAKIAEVLGVTEHQILFPSSLYLLKNLEEQVELNDGDKMEYGKVFKDKDEQINHLKETIEAMNAEIESCKDKIVRLNGLLDTKNQIITCKNKLLRLYESKFGIEE